jgi:DegV family protein with EDD domain
MEKVRIVTDTNSGIDTKMAEELGVTVVPMPFTIDGVDHLENVTCTYEEFFKKLGMGADVSTSQPSPGDLIEVWDKVLENYDSLVYIPMSSSLSSSCASANGLAQDYDGRVQVVDNMRISLSLYQSVLDAVRLAKYGMSASEIKAVLEREASEQSIYITVNTLELLKKSGRVTKAGAALATVLGLKPVLQIQGGKLDAYKKARGMDKAKLNMIDAIKNDLATRFNGKKYQIAVAYSGSEAEALKWKKQVEEAFPGEEIMMHPLPISICCHIGDGAMAVAVTKVL